VKNVYARFSYGERRDGEVYDPYVQLMPITDIVDAHHEWETWCAKWGGSSSQPSSTSTVQPTPGPSSLSAPPSPSSLSPPHSSSSTPASASSPSSASDPLATGESGKISGAVEDDGTEVKSDPVRSFPFYSPNFTCLTYLPGQTLLTCHHHWCGPRRPCSHWRYRLRRDEEARRSRRQGDLSWLRKAR